MLSKVASSVVNILVFLVAEVHVLTVILCETFLHCAFSNVSSVCFLVFLVAGAPCNPLGCSVSPGRGV